VQDDLGPAVMAFVQVVAAGWGVGQLHLRAKPLLPDNAALPRYIVTLELARGVAGVGITDCCIGARALACAHRRRHHVNPVERGRATWAE
jgi:hypothetical protein